MRVGLTALEGDADGDLAERASRERIGSGQSLAAEQNVNSKRSALSNEAVEQ